MTNQLRSPLRSSLRSPFEHRRGGSALVALSIPVGFDWVPPVNFYRSSSGEYSTDYDPAPHLVEGDPGVTTYYVDGQAGSESNPGTALLPKKSLVAISGGRQAKLLIKARGIFYHADTGPVQTAHDSLCVEAWGGAECILTTENADGYPFTWTDEGGGVWSTTPRYATNNGINVYLGTAVNSLARYASAVDLAACQATPGTIFRDLSAGIKHYVHTLDGTSPGAGHTIYGTADACQTFLSANRDYDQHLSFHGISFRGGNTAFAILGDSAFDKRVDFVNCSFKHANNFGVLNCSGTCLVITYQCEAGPSVFDGFAYSTASGGEGGNVNKAVEINNTAWGNGVASAANQGSTTHFGGKLVRVNGNYHENANDQVADVGAGTRSWNMGCTFGPNGIGSGYSGATAGIDATDIRMWLDGCSFSGVDYDVTAASGATIYYRNMPAPGASPTSSGTISAY